MDAQTHAHLQTLDPIQRAEYLSKLHKRNLLLRQGLIFSLKNSRYFNSSFSFEKNLKLTFISIPRTGFIQQGNAVQGQPRPPNHIITRPQMPGAPMQWMQQQVPLVLSVQCLDN